MSDARDKFYANSDADARRFLDRILDELGTRFGYTEEQAIERLHAVTGHMHHITGDHVIYHETPDYWAQAAHYGRRDSWRKT